jgi:two-component SAPR family response regulator
MPVLNGFELCKKIREVDSTVKIIFITASERYYELKYKNILSILYDIYIVYCDLNSSYYNS